MATPVVTPVRTQPDISYHPDLEKFNSRTERLVSRRSLPPTLPSGFPAKLSSPLVWEGKEYTNEGEWTFPLNEAQLQEVDNALSYFKCKENSERLRSFYTC